MSHEHNPKQFHGDPTVLLSKERLERLEIRRVVRLSLEGVEVQTVLDVGTGSGLFAMAFSQLGLAVTGLDINPELLQMAQKLAAQANFVEGKAEEIPFPDQHFDLVFLGHLLHESETPGKVLQEAKRVAKTRAVILEWPHKKEPFGPPIEHRLKPKQIETFAKKAGFSIIEQTQLTHMVLFRLTP